MFITFEGIEGSGKSTLIRLVAEFLQNLGHKVMLTREPGGSGLGQEIRAMLLDCGRQNLAPEAELYLFLADRAQHVREVILPALNAGQIVLCDRFQDSTIAYQGFGRQFELDRLKKMIEPAALNIKPNLTILLDLPVEIGLARAQKRNTVSGSSLSEGRFEAEARNFHERVRSGFLALQKSDPQRIKLIDASQDIGIVYGDCLEILQAWLAEQG